MRNWFFIFFVFFAISSNAQKTFSAGVIGGINGCQIHGDSYSGYSQIGFVAGAFVQNNPDEKWQGQFGIQYSRKGSRHVLPRQYGGYKDFEIRSNYIDIPAFVRYNTKKVFFDFGLTFGVMFKVRTWDANGETVPQDFRKWEIAMINGIGYNISDHFYIELTTQNSIIPIKPFPTPVLNYGNVIARIFNRGMYNNLLGVMFGYRFGGGGNE